MKINIGAGGVKIDGYVSCDYDALSNPDYVFDLENDQFPFEDNSVNTVVASHVLEHLGEGYFHCLKELYRVCEHGAIIHVNVPHHRNDYFHDDPTHRRAITVDGLRLFSKKYNAVCKKQGVYASRLGDFFNVDFEIVEFNYKPMDQYRIAFEGKQKEEVEQYIFEHCNILEEVIIKLVVIKQYE
jgi:predicted SAM-dependent methyltransferase